MRFISRKHKNLHHMLTEIYRSKETTPVDDQWQAEVLRRVRQTGYFQHGQMRSARRRPKLPLKRLVPATGVALAILIAIAVICFHGVPETEHPWVNTPRKVFESFMEHLHDHDYTVIAMRDLARDVDPRKRPEDPWEIIEQRRAAATRERGPSSGRE